ncbi:MAG: 23S rRNA (guanosine(2251)-2'-O)-methyltransferase RlmB [Spirochaetaceae bacterium]|jgi:23S rRNA (guanosine2251-2'-O)-methyltransferase|nr:23S rRNA (guanosine(2251)-2'-O)-methyltransferase RlmB [Spirochaetaceae bacterium]
MAYLTGFHAIEERIRAGKAAGPLLVAKAGPRARELVEIAIEKKIRIERTGSHELDRLAAGNRGIALEVEDGIGTDAGFDELLANLSGRERALVVILDEITDPHNYGAIVRSCDQFGVDMVVTRTKRIAKHTDVIASASAGASAWAPIVQVPNLSRAVEMLKEADFWVYGADMDGELAWKKDLRGRTALIAGGEEGLSRLLRESCDALVALPSLGHVDSLNVSVAVGALLYEIVRQQS